MAKVVDGEGHFYSQLADLLLLIQHQPSVVDQDVNHVEPALDEIGELLDGLPLGQVQWVAFQLASLDLGNGLNGFFILSHIPAAENHVVALLIETLDSLVPDSIVASSHYNVLRSTHTQSIRKILKIYSYLRIHLKIFQKQFF
jgi:hypothetical protein